MGLPSFFVIKLPRMWIWNQLDQNIYIVPQKRADWDRDFLQKPTAFLQHSAKDRFLLQLAAQPDTIEGTTQEDSLLFELPDFPEIRLESADMAEGIALVKEQVQETILTLFRPPVPTQIDCTQLCSNQLAIQLVI